MAGEQTVRDLLNRMVADREPLAEHFTDVMSDATISIKIDFKHESGRIYKVRIELNEHGFEEKDSDD